MNMRCKKIAVCLVLMVGVSSITNGQSVLDYLLAGNSKAEKKDYDGAIINYDLAAALYIMYVDSTKKAGVPASSLKDYINFTQVFYNRGLAKSNLKEYRSAIEDYSTTISLKPTHANAYFNRAQAEFYIHDYKAALQDFNKYIELNPGNASSYFSRGVVKIRLEQVEEGCMDLKKAAAAGYVVPADLSSKYCK
jgi:tetratricopeptide (TPR) repeat protein